MFEVAAAHAVVRPLGRLGKFGWVKSGLGADLCQQFCLWLGLQFDVVVFGVSETLFNY